MGSEETREAIIRASIGLFSERGYEKTTVQAIIDSVGVSKGAFYHHFSSKEEIVEAITDGYITEGLEYLQETAGEADLTTAEKLNRVIQGSQLYRARRQDTREAIERAFAGGRNLKLERAIAEKARAQTLPLFTRILEDGISRGELQIGNAGAHGEILFHLLLGMKESLRERMHAGADSETVGELLGVYEDAVCRVLRLPEGSIRLAAPYVSRLYGTATEQNSRHGQRTRS